MKSPVFIDSHSHLYLDAFDDDLDQVILRAKEENVGKIYLPNIDSSSIQRLRVICKKHEDIFSPMMGLHPTSVKENYKEELSIIKEELFSSEYIAVGEIGLDLYWDKTFVLEQEEVFKTQIEWAKELDLPIVIHARDSFSEIFEIMDKLIDKNLKGVFHSFTGDKNHVKKILSYGFYIGINGIVTFKNSKLAEVVRSVPLNKLLLETDSPFLAPVPYRGKRNESSYLKLVADTIAKVQGCSVQEIAKQTTENAQTLFGTIL